MSMLLNGSLLLNYSCLAVAIKGSGFFMPRYEGPIGEVLCGSDLWELSQYQTRPAPSVWLC